MSIVYENMYKQSSYSDVIGLPPSMGKVDESLGDRDDKLIRASFPVARIAPALPTTVGDKNSGLHLFSLDYGTGRTK